MTQFWPAWLSSLGIVLQSEKSPGSLVRERTWVVGQVPGWGRARGNRSVLPFLPFYSENNNLKKKKISWHKTRNLEACALHRVNRFLIKLFSLLGHHWVLEITGYDQDDRTCITHEAHSLFKQMHRAYMGSSNPDCAHLIDVFSYETKGNGSPNFLKISQTTSPWTK